MDQLLNLFTFVLLPLAMAYPAYDLWHEQHRGPHPPGPVPPNDP